MSQEKFDEEIQNKLKYFKHILEKDGDDYQEALKYASESNNISIDSVDFLDIFTLYDETYIVDRDMNYLGSRLMIAGGGPNIWIDTYERKIKLYWWTDYGEIDYIDNWDVQSIGEELYQVALETKLHELKK